MVKVSGVLQAVKISRFPALQLPRQVFIRRR